MDEYEPINELKPVGEDIWIVDGGAISFYGAPFTTRMTIIRLSSGDLFCHSPVALTPALKSAVEALGPVRHLVSPNWIHYAYIQQWADAFPGAITWASPNVGKRATKAGMPVRFDHDLGPAAEEVWGRDIDQMIVGGSSMHQEVVFFHRRTQTLILTDLIENFETHKIPLWLRPLAWLAGILDPDGKAPIDMRFSFMFGREALRKAVQTMIGWAPKRIILAHGRWYDKNAVAELKRAFRWVL